MSIINLPAKDCENLTEAKFLAWLLQEFAEHKKHCVLRHRVRFFDQIGNVSVEINLIPSHDWYEFHSWCKNKNIIVHQKSKMIDTQSIFWPTRIEIIVDQDNEEFVLFKLMVL